MKRKRPKCCCVPFAGLEGGTVPCWAFLCLLAPHYGHWVLFLLRLRRLSCKPVWIVKTIIWSALEDPNLSCNFVALFLAQYLKEAKVQNGIWPAVMNCAAPCHFPGAATCCFRAICNVGLLPPAERAASLPQIHTTASDFKWWRDSCLSDVTSLWGIHAVCQYN